MQDDVTPDGYRLLADIRDYEQLRVAHGSDREAPQTITTIQERDNS